MKAKRLNEVYMLLGFLIGCSTSYDMLKPIDREKPVVEKSANYLEEWGVIYSVNVTQDSIYKTTGSIVSNATISTGKQIEMLAQEKVELQENFEAPQTSTLYVNMEECREKPTD